MRKLKKVQALFLIMLLIIPILTQSIIYADNKSTVKSDSNTYRSTMIQLAYNKSMAELSEGVGKLTADDLRPLALYLSNTYIPFSTRFTSNMSSSDSSSSSETAKQFASNMEEQMKEMKKALSRAGIHKDFQELIAKTVVQKNIDTLHPLVVNANELDAAVRKAEHLEQVPDSLVVKKSSDWKIFDIASAKGGDTIYANPDLYKLDKGISFFTAEVREKEYSNECVTIGGQLYVPVTYMMLYELLYATEDIIKFYWNDNGTLKEVFSNRDNCAVAMFLMYNYANLKNGYGTSFFTLTDEELDAMVNDAEVAEKTDTSFDKYTAYTAPIYVDWVGDLMLSTGAGFEVVLPACLNPYTFSSITEGVITYENSLPINNVFAIGYSGTLQGNSLLHIVKDKNNKRTLKLWAQKGGGWASDSLIPTDSDHILFRRYSGTGSIDFDRDHTWFKVSAGATYDYLKGTDLGNIIKTVNMVSGRNTAPFPVFTYLFSDGKSNIELLKKIFPDLYKDFVEVIDPDIKQLPSNAVLYMGKHQNAFIPNDEIIQYTTNGITSNKSLDEIFLKAPCLDVSKNFASKFSISDYTSIKEKNHVIAADDGNYFLNSLFLTYVFAYFNKGESTYDASKNVIDLKFNYELFPLANSNLDFSDIQVGNSTADEVTSMAYWLLHPTKGGNYAGTWLKNKVSGALLKWHDDMVGNTDSNTSLGMTKYLSTSSYTTTPALRDIEWLSKLTDGYTNIVVYLIIAITIIMLCYIIIGNITLPRAIATVLIFSFLAFLPPIAINTVINITNTTSEIVYGKKFDYWAIVQLQQYLTAISIADKTDEDGNDMRTEVEKFADTILMNAATSGEDEETDGNYSSVKLKWISPKRFNVLTELFNELKKNSNIPVESFIGRAVISSISQETDGQQFLTNTTNAAYLWRDIGDLYRYAAMSRNIMDDAEFGAEFDMQAAKIGNVDDVTTTKIVDKWTSKNREANSNYNSYAINGPEDSINLYNFNNNNAFTSLSTIKYSSGQDLYKYVYSNVDSYKKASISDAIGDTSSLMAVKRGFLYPCAAHYDTDNYKCYYNADNATAASFFLRYSGVLGEIQAKREKFKRDIIETENGRLLDTEISYGKNIYGINPDNFVTGVQQLQGYIDDLHNKDILQDPTTRLHYMENINDRLHGLFYALYAESPYYYFYNNIEDCLKTYACKKKDYEFNGWNKMENISSGNTRSVEESAIFKLFNDENQRYFFNIEDGAGDGYGELRDFMNMHDLFYYIMPSLQCGVDLVHDWDKELGYYTYDTCNLQADDAGNMVYYFKSGIDGDNKDSDVKAITIFSIDPDTHTIKWFPKGTEDLEKIWGNDETDDINDGTHMTKQERYELVHDLNVQLLFYAYCNWLDTMEDCEYSKPQAISVSGERFYVENPLDPTSYFRLDENGNMIAGRYMVFSESEMKYYGLTSADLTTVEQKIIRVQRTVYNKAIDLLNYCELSNEVVLNSYALLQLFEFNKEFSQQTLFKDSYILYPQGYELKAFTYDAYMRMVVSEASGESLMYSHGDNGENLSIYARIQANTSIFFSIFLVLNDLLAVYILPALKLIFIVLMFFLSIGMLFMSALKVDNEHYNMFSAIWKALILPMLLFAGITIGMAWVVSLFLSPGPQNVVKTETQINLGDPTAAVIIMLVINVVVLILYCKLIKRTWKDMITVFKDTFLRIAGAVTAVGAIIASTARNGMGVLRRAGSGAVGIGRSIAGIPQRIRNKENAENLSTIAKDAKARGKQNTARGTGNMAGGNGQFTPVTKGEGGVNRQVENETSMNNLNAKAMTDKKGVLSGLSQEDKNNIIGRERAADELFKYGDINMAKNFKDKINSNGKQYSQLQKDAVIGDVSAKSAEFMRNDDKKGKHELHKQIVGAQYKTLKENMSPEDFKTLVRNRDKANANSREISQQASAKALGKKIGVSETKMLEYRELNKATPNQRSKWSKKEKDNYKTLDTLIRTNTKAYTDKQKLLKGK